jgi:hypothetical protein
VGEKLFIGQFPISFANLPDYRQLLPERFVDRLVGSMFVQQERRSGRSNRLSDPTRK